MAYLVSPIGGGICILAFLLFIWGPCVVIASIVGHQKGNLAAGFLLGLFLGPIGVRIAGGLIPPEKKD
jgi:hypothetical protein